MNHSTSSVVREVNTAPISYIYSDIWFKIFDFLNPRELLRISGTNKFFRDLIRTSSKYYQFNGIYYARCPLSIVDKLLEVFPNLNVFAEPQGTNINYKFKNHKNFIGLDIYNYSGGETIQTALFPNLKYMLRAGCTILPTNHVFQNLHTIFFANTTIDNLSPLKNIKELTFKHCCGKGFADLSAIANSTFIRFMECLDIGDTTVLARVKCVIFHGSNKTTTGQQLLDLNPLKSNEYVIFNKLRFVSVRYNSPLYITHLFIKIQCTGVIRVTITNIMETLFVDAFAVHVILPETPEESKLETLIIRSSTRRVLERICNFPRLKILYVEPNVFNSTVIPANIERLTISDEYSTPIFESKLKYLEIENVAYYDGRSSITYADLVVLSVNKKIEVENLHLRYYKIIDMTNFSGMRSVTLTHCDNLNYVIPLLSDLHEVRIHGSNNKDIVDILPLANVHVLELRLMHINTDDLYKLYGVHLLKLYCVYQCVLPSTRPFNLKLVHRGVFDELDEMHKIIEDSSIQICTVDICRLSWLYSLSLTGVKYIGLDESTIPIIKLDNFITQGSSLLDPIFARIKLANVSVSMIVKEKYGFKYEDNLVCDDKACRNSICRARLREVLDYYKF